MSGRVEVVVHPDPGSYGQLAKRLGRRLPSHVELTKDQVKLRAAARFVLCLPGPAARAGRMIRTRAQQEALDAAVAAALEKAGAGGLAR